MVENIGKINFGNAYINYFSLIASLGISTYAIRECARVRSNREKLDETASQIFSINLITTLISYILLAVSLLVFRDLDSYRTLIIVQSTTILFATLGADWINTAFEDFAFITLRTAFFQFVSLVLMFLFVKEPDDYLIYAAITAFSSSAANVVNIIYRRNFCNIRFTLNIEWKKHIAPILWLFGMILSQTIFVNADVTMLGLIKGDYAVGIYTTASKIERLVSQLVASLLFVLMPRLSFMFAKRDYVEINLLLRKVLGGFLLLGLPAFVGTFILAPEFISIIAGESFKDSASVLRIIIFSFLFSLIGGSFLGNIVLLPSGRERLFTVIFTIATVFNVVANLIFIPLYGAHAAAATTAISSLLIMILLIYTKDPNIRFSNMFELIKGPILGCVFIAVYCYGIKLFVDSTIVITIASIAGSALIYGIIQIITHNEIVIQTLSKLKK